MDKTVKYILYVGFFKNKEGRESLRMDVHKDGGKYLEAMKKMKKPNKNLLLLGEPDYIDLYLKHFPIITSPYLT